MLVQKILNFLCLFYMQSFCFFLKGLETKTLSIVFITEYTECCMFTTSLTALILLLELVSVGSLYNKNVIFLFFVKKRSNSSKVQDEVKFYNLLIFVHCLCRYCMTFICYLIFFF